MKNKFLFITEKWCDGNPNSGLTNNFHNLFDTFEQRVINYEKSHLFLDEVFLTQSKHIDNVLLEYLFNNKVDILFCSFLGQSSMNPSADCLKKIKKMGIFIILNWPDSNPGDLTVRDNLYDVSDLNIIWDTPSSSIHDHRALRNKDVFLWAPQNEKLFYPDKQEIPVSFVGSTIYPDRFYFLSNLIKIYPIFISGGQRENGLTQEQYASIIRRSKININFSLSSHSSGFYQLKGRVIEVLASSSLLLEFKNPSTRKILTPGVEYVEFEDVDNLARKIKFYLENDDDRTNISKNGYNKYLQCLTSQHFWDTVISNIK